MIPSKCRIPHKPDEGKYGDCIRACVASIMDIENPETVPHFMQSGEIDVNLLREWLASQGNFAPYLSVYGPELDIHDLTHMQAVNNPDIHYIIFGSNATGYHAAVYLNDQKVHDPSWSPSPMVKPGRDDRWVIMVIARK